MIKKYKWRNSKKIIKQLKKGNVGIMPTAGVYGIFALATPENVDIINKIKKSDKNKKLSILFPNVEEVFKWMRIDEEREYLVRENLPGLTTFILKPKTIWIEETGFSDLKDGVGVRVTTNYNLSQIVKETGPLLTTSANVSGYEVITKTDQVKEMFEKTEQGIIAHPPVNGGELDSIGYACEVMKRFKPKITVVYLSSVDVCHSNFTSYLKRLHRADHGVGHL
ncbi:MAG: Sua5/YciO/YrdC/YwlC family protein, partial [Mycoplasmataceae bacterium]|nr:Sua5/YciO/YrdC/YwlC family protein [Mycoplasmataceae bacterium]